MNDELVLTFVAEQVSARAHLLREQAPRTCDGVLALLPLTLRAHHAIYSGSEIATILPEVVRLDPENSTSEVSPGDLAFVWLEEGSHYGVDRDFSELCWFYDIDARPSMFEGPGKVSVFAKLSNADEFFAVCRRMRIEGAKEIEIRRA